MSVKNKGFLRRALKGIGWVGFNPNKVDRVVFLTRILTGFLGLVSYLVFCVLSSIGFVFLIVGEIESNLSLEESKEGIIGLGARIGFFWFLFYHYFQLIKNR